MFTLLKN